LLNCGETRKAKRRYGSPPLGPQYGWTYTKLSLTGVVWVVAIPQLNHSKPALCCRKKSPQPPLRPGLCCCCCWEHGGEVKADASSQPDHGGSGF